jgi:hypothetical protein
MVGAVRPCVGGTVAQARTAQARPVADEDSGRARVCLSAVGQKLNRLADHVLTGVIGPKRKEMWVVADQMRGVAIDGTEQEHHVLRVHGVVAEVEEDNRHDLAMTGQQPDERLHFRRRDPARQEFLRILGERVEAVEKEELSLLPAVEDFRVGVRRVTAQAGRQQDLVSSTARKGPGIYSRAVMS